MSNDDFKPEDDDQVEMLRQVGKAIDEMLGGSARAYTLQQLGDGVVMMVFEDDGPETLETLTKLREAASPLSGQNPLDLEGKHPLNIFGNTTSGKVH